ncbi:MAG: hypothetical protein KI790_05445 [Cyclobacteriaceae bacterium]|nr:hypothetical protein [Cyclobacteriaceae bacterium HetDA_MAG_MS6]
MRQFIIILGVICSIGLNAQTRELGVTGQNGRWVKVARIQNQNPIGNGESTTFSGLVNIQTDYGQTGSSQYLAIFSFGVRGGITPQLTEFGATSMKSATDPSRVEWRIYRAPNGWHYLWFWQSNYSKYAKFDYKFVSGVEYWTAEDPPVDYVQVWSSYGGERQVVQFDNIVVGGHANGTISARHLNGKSHLNAEEGNLYLNYHSPYPVIVGTTSNLADFLVHGKVGIGTTSPSSKLEVNGTIRSKEVKVEASPWPDYVFFEDYKLMTIAETEAYIQQNQKLPDMPSAAEVETNGIALGEMNSKLLEKIEELTLYVIELKKENDDLRQSHEHLSEKVNSLMEE